MPVHIPSIIITLPIRLVNIKISLYALNSIRLPSEKTAVDIDRFKNYATNIS
jgi:hypothetical protein